MRELARRTLTHYAHQCALNLTSHSRAGLRAATVGRLASILKPGELALLGPNPFHVIDAMITDEKLIP